MRYVRVTIGVGLLVLSGCGAASTTTTSADGSTSTSLGRAEAATVPPSKQPDPIVLVELAPTKRSVTIAQAGFVRFLESWTADSADTIGGPSFGASAMFAQGSFDRVVMVVVNAHAAGAKVGELPRTTGLNSDAGDAIKVSGRRASMMKFPDGGTVVAWVAADGVEISVASRNLTVDELIEVGELVDIPSLDECFVGSCEAELSTRGTAQARAAGAIPPYDDAPYIIIEG